MNLRPFLARMRQHAPLVLVLLGAVVAVAAYLQALHYPFVSDDSGSLILFWNRFGAPEVGACRVSLNILKEWEHLERLDLR